MRDRPFITAAEAPRKFSEIRAERAQLDPLERSRERILAEIAQFEGEAQATSHPAERAWWQCEAEALRCALDGK